MRCIFCKTDSSDSRSVEHIIPESLGNKSHTLSRGIVCDRCNNYFAVKVEKVVLEMPYFRSLRGRNEIENKKGKISGISGFIKDHKKTELEVFFTSDDIIEVVVENKGLYNSIGKYNRLYIPILHDPPKDDLYISKFIGKVALEALALRVSKVEGWQDEFINNEGLDQLRDFVRYGRHYKFWPYHTRKIYNENHINFDRETSETYEVLHEFDFLFPDKPKINGGLHTVDDLYFVLAIMGIEYTINMTDAGLDRYMKWLADNRNKSILLMEKSEFNS